MLRYLVGAVRRIRGKISKERLTTFLLLLYPTQSLLKKNIGTVSLGLFKAAVVFNNWVEIAVTRNIR